MKKFGQKIIFALRAFMGHWISATDKIQSALAMLQIDTGLFENGITIKSLQKISKIFVFFRFVSKHFFKINLTFINLKFILFKFDHSNFEISGWREHFFRQTFSSAPRAFFWAYFKKIRALFLPDFYHGSLQNHLRAWSRNH